MPRTGLVIGAILVLALALAACRGSAGQSDKPDGTPVGPGVGDLVYGSADGPWPLTPDSVRFQATSVVADCGGHLCRWELTAKTESVADLAGVANRELSQDGTTALAIQNNRILVFDTTTGEVQAVFEQHEPLRDGTAFGPIHNVSLSPDGDLAASTGQDGKAYVWSTKDATEVSRLDLPDAAFARPVFSPDGSQVVVAYTDRDDASRATVLDTATGKVVSEIPDLVSVFDWSPDGRWLIGKHSDMTVGLWDTEDFSHHASIGVDSIGPAAFSPDSSQVAFVALPAPKSVTLWDITSEEITDTISTGHPDNIGGIAWSPNGQRLATASTQATGEPAPAPSNPRDQVEIRRVDGKGSVHTLRLPTN